MVGDPLSARKRALSGGVRGQTWALKGSSLGTGLSTLARWSRLAPELSARIFRKSKKFAKSQWFYGIVETVSKR